MNHLVVLLALSLSADPAATSRSPYEIRKHRYTGGEYQDETFSYRMMAPEQIEPGKRYPVVLFLHGAGERGTDNQKQLLYFPALMAQPEQRKKYPCFVIAPQCRPGKQWVNVPWGAKNSTPLPEMPSDQLQVAWSILNAILNHPAADPQRVYLTGLSMGGYGSWDLACRHPETFAALAPICGGGDERQAAKLVDLPTWAFHGDADRAVPVERSRQMIEAIRAAGGEPKYSELPGVGHNSWNPAYRDPEGLIPWMFKQQREQ